MTLIGITCHGDHAELVTDSWRYSPSLLSLKHTTKTMMLSHLDAALLTQGAATFGHEAGARLSHLATEVDTFDELVGEAERPLRAAWATVAEGQDTTHVEARVFVVGWSPVQERFTAHGLFLENHFTPKSIDNAYLQPTPWTLRPHDFEIQSWKRLHPDDPGWQDWLNNPRVQPPRSPDEWSDLIAGARGRALSSFLSVPVGGKIFHTHIERGHQTTSLIHEYDTTIPELLGIVHYSLHPLAQVQDCWCGSGQPYRSCHLQGHRAAACLCRSGRPLEACCLLTDTEAEPLRETLLSVLSEEEPPP